MLSNWVKATTTTTGTGPLTLSAVPDYPSPLAAFGAGEMVEYSLLASNGDKEAGVGTVGSGSLFLRSVVTATYVGGVYSKESLTNISLPAGTHELICTPTAAGLFEPQRLPCRFPSPSYESTVYSGSLHSTTATLAVQAAGKSIAYPFLLHTAGLLGSMAVNVTSGGAGSLTRLGLYKSGSNGLPSALLAATSDISTVTTGFKSSSVITPIRLTPGWYWVALNVISGSLPSLTSSFATDSPAGSDGILNLKSVRTFNVTANLDNPFVAFTSDFSLEFVTSSAAHHRIGLVLS